jgi:glycosyltransferase involved in cell wall biosynthesis
MSAVTVSVVMPVCNVSRYVARAVESICSQSFGDFELIIINDGSTDETPEILRGYEKREKRIRFCDQKRQGVVASLNYGCSLARGNYIARMDGDDISLPMRFEKQVAYLKEHSDVSVCGTWTESIDEHDCSLGVWRVPTEPDVLGWHLLFGNYLAHPSVMFSRSLITGEGLYREQALHIEDYDAWARLNATVRFANIPEVLLKRRVWKKSVSAVHGLEQEASNITVMAAALSDMYGATVPQRVVSVFREIVCGRPVSDTEDIRAASAVLQRLYHKYNRRRRMRWNERMSVAGDAAAKMHALASCARRRSLMLWVLLFCKALILYPPRLLSWGASKCGIAIVKK